MSLRKYLHQVVYNSKKKLIQLFKHLFNPLERAETHLALVPAPAIRKHPAHAHGNLFHDIPGVSAVRCPRAQPRQAARLRTGRRVSQPSECPPDRARSCRNHRCSWLGRWVACGAGPAEDSATAAVATAKASKPASAGYSPPHAARCSACFPGWRVSG